MKKHKHAIDEKYLHTEEQAIELINSREEQFYVYILINPLNNLPFYVGKGQGNRCTVHFYVRLKKKSRKNNFLKKLHSLGKEPLYVFEKFTFNEEEAYSIESVLIKKYGQKDRSKIGILYNIETSSNKRAYSEKKKEFITKSNIRHNRLYDYSKVKYKGYKIPVEIICSKHGSFWQAPGNHSKRGDGCPSCSGNKRLNISDVLKKLNIVHKNKYTYPKFEYINNSTEFEIICPEHGSFWQSYSTHSRGVGCYECGVIQASRKKSKQVGLYLKEELIELFDSYKSASNWLEIDRQMVRRYINNKQELEIDGLGNYYIKDYNETE